MRSSTDPDSIDDLVRKRVDALLPAMLEEHLARRQAARTPALTIIATKGTLDWAYPPFILATTAAALGWNASVFFTFYGLNLLRKDVSGLRVSPLGYPAMPMKLPFGPGWLRRISWNVPNAVQSVIPGFEAVASDLMRRTMRDKGVATVGELRSMAVEAGVRLIGCQMTVDLFGHAREDFIPEVEEFVGAASFLPVARDAEVNLFV